MSAPIPSPRAFAFSGNTCSPVSRRAVYVAQVCTSSGWWTALVHVDNTGRIRLFWPRLCRSIFERSRDELARLNPRRSLWRLTTPHYRKMYGPQWDNLQQAAR